MMRYINTLFLLIFSFVCACAIESTTEVQYSKINKLNNKNSGSYYIVFHKFQNQDLKYNEFADNISNEMNKIGFVRSYDIKTARYILIFKYGFMYNNKIGFFSKSKIYKSEIDITLYDNQNKEILYDENDVSNMRFSPKIIFQGKGLIESNVFKSYKIWTQCLVQAIFYSKNNQNYKINDKFQDISSKQGIYLCDI